jgi:hypothetical protein
MIEPCPGVFQGRRRFVNEGGQLIHHLFGIFGFPLFPVDIRLHLFEHCQVPDFWNYRPA